MMGPAIYAGGAVAGVLLIIGIIVIIVLWRRRKPSSDGMLKCPLLLCSALGFQLRANIQKNQKWFGKG